MISKNAQDHIDEIMDYFEFEKVQRMIEAVKWRWIFPNEESRTPDTADLRQKARELLKDAWKGTNVGNTNSVGTGGFVASCYQDEQGKWLKLTFEADSWDTEEGSWSISEH